LCGRIPLIFLKQFVYNCFDLVAALFVEANLAVMNDSVAADENAGGDRFDSQAVLRSFIVENREGKFVLARANVDTKA